MRSPSPGDPDHGVQPDRDVDGTAADGFGRRIRAETRTYTDSNNGIETITQHARIDGLEPHGTYVYRIVSDGETQVSGVFRTAPEGRVPFPVHQRRRHRLRRHRLFQGVTQLP